MSDLISLSELRTEVRRRSDYENTSYISDTELNSYLNESLRWVYDQMVKAFKKYHLCTFRFATVSNQDTYLLPDRFYKLDRVDADAQGNSPYPLAPYQFNEEYSFIYNVNNIPVTTINLWYTPTFRPLTETAKTFTDGSVSVANDTITMTDHTLVTGEQLTFTNSGGALPTGIVSGTTYFAILVDKNIFKIASNPTNAINGVAIDITAASGGGTHTLSGDFDKFRSLNGFHMLAVWDTVVAVLTKAERDTQQTNVERQKEFSRLQEMLTIRDPGRPMRMWDANRVDNYDEAYYWRGSDLRYHLVGPFIRLIETTYRGDA